MNKKIENMNKVDEELDSYIINMKYKIAHHSMFGTNLIKTYSRYNDGRSLLEHLQEELIKKGFVLNKKVGDEIEMGGLLGTAPVMPVHGEGSVDFINRGGRIPAPLQSLKN